MNFLFRGTLYFQTGQAATNVLVKGQLFDIWLVSRESCVFETVDLSMVPKAMRKSALLQQIKTLSPYKDFQYSSKWEEGFASTWIWDSAWQEKIQQGAGVKNDITVASETSFTIPIENGFRPIRGVDGFIIQIWDQKKLVAEGCWSAEPTFEDVSWFFESNNRTSPTAPLDWVKLDYDDPFQNFFIKQKEILQLALSSAFFIFLFFFSFQLADISRTSFQIKQVQGAVDEEKLKKLAVLELRSKVLQDMDTLENFQLLDRPRQVELMSALSSSLSDEKGNLIEWSYEAGTIEALFSETENSPALIVEKLESSGLYSSVSLDIDTIRKTVKIRMELADAS